MHVHDAYLGPNWRAAKTVTAMTSANQYFVIRLELRRLFRLNNKYQYNLDGNPTPVT